MIPADIKPFPLLSVWYCKWLTCFLRNRSNKRTNIVLVGHSWNLNKSNDIYRQQKWHFEVACDNRLLNTAGASWKQICKNVLIMHFISCVHNILSSSWEHVQKSMKQALFFRRFSAATSNSELAKFWVSWKILQFLAKFLEFFFENSLNLSRNER